MELSLLQLELELVDFRLRGQNLLLVLESLSLKARLLAHMLTHLMLYRVNSLELARKLITQLIDLLLILLDHIGMLLLHLLSHLVVLNIVKAPF